MIQVNLMHIFLIAPTLIYIGSSNLDNTNNYLNYAFNSLITFIFMIPFIVRANFIKFNFENFTKVQYINLFHFMIPFFLFNYLGFKNRKISNFEKKSCFLLGILLIFIHIYYLLNKFI